MRYILFFLFFVLAISVKSQIYTNADNNYVIFKHGQSNSVGGGDTADLYNPYWGNVNCYIWTDSGWYTLNAHINNNQYPHVYPMGKFGQEMSLSYYLQNITKGNIYIIKYAYGGTALADAGPYNWNINHRGGSYDSAKVTQQRALAALNAANIPYTILGAYWFQGEADGVNLTYSTDYYNNLVDYITAVRNDLGMPNLYWTLIRIRYFTGYDCPRYYRSMIRDADSLFVANDNGNSCFVDVEDLTAYDTCDSHLSSASNITLGNRLGAAIEPKLEIRQIYLFKKP